MANKDRLLSTIGLSSQIEEVHKIVVGHLRTILEEVGSGLGGDKEVGEEAQIVVCVDHSKELAPSTQVDIY